MRSSGILSLLFFASGITGLVYEVLWAKYLALFLGNTALGQTIVLATFMGGLALGNALLGPWADKIRNPLRFYGWLEMAIGALGVTSPLLLSFFSNVHSAIARGVHQESILAASLGVLSSMGVLLIPAMLMGGTLPALSRTITRSLPQLEPKVSWLYFINSAGAAAGALAAGFFLIPSFGLDASTMAAAVLNVAIGLVVLFLSNVDYQEAPVAEYAEAVLPRPQVPKVRLFVPILYVSVFASGFLALGYEIVWIRLLTLVLGSSTYSFSLMLAAFISGIALGSYLVHKRIAPRVDSYRLFAIAQIGIAVSILLTLPLYGKLPYYFLVLSGLLNRTAGSFYLFELGKFLFCFCLMLLPTLFLGMTLPLATRAVTNSVEQVGEKVGRIFSLNTLGNVLGAVVTGLLLVPLFGIQKLLQGGALANLALGFFILGTIREGKTPQKSAAFTACWMAAILWVNVLPGWNKLMLTGGIYRKHTTPAYVSYKEFKEAFKGLTLLFYKDDANATITVLKVDANGDLLLKLNGKTDASSGADMATQALIGHIPLLLKPDSKDVMVVGLASGVTAGSVLCHPVERLDVAELIPAMVPASKFFDKFNHDPLQDKRLRLHLEDAKTFLKRSADKYDVIISEPPNPWIAGVGNLFTVEFYQEAKARLKEGGLMVQWVQTYEMNDEIFAMILRTFTSVFEHTGMWNSGGNDIVLVGSTAALSPDLERMQDRFDSQEVRGDLSGVGIKNLATFLSLQVGSDATVLKMAGAGRLNRDTFPILEYEAPKAFFLGVQSNLVQTNDERLNPAGASGLPFAQYLAKRTAPLSSTEFQEMANFYRAHGERFLRYVVSDWTQRYPKDADALWALFLVQRKEGKKEDARRTMERLLLETPANAGYLESAADLEFEIFLENNSILAPANPGNALSYLQRAADSGAANKAQIFRKMAQIYLLRKDYSSAIKHYEEAAGWAMQKTQSESRVNASQDPESINSGPRADALWMEAASAALQSKDFKKALACAQEALKINPENAGARHLEQDLIRTLAGNSGT